MHANQTNAWSLKNIKTFSYALPQKDLNGVN